MKINKKQTFLDGLAKKDNRIREVDLPLAKYVSKYKRSSVLFSRSRRSEVFFTEDSKLYLTSDELKKIKRGERVEKIIGRLDSLNSRIFENTRIYAGTQKEDFFSSQLKKQYRRFRENALELVQDSTQKISVVKLWNLSIVGAVIFGMFTMTMIYRYLGQGVSAKINESAEQRQIVQLPEKTQEEEGEEMSNNIDLDSITSIMSEQAKEAEFEAKIMEMVKGHPIEAMVPEIVKKDRIVAAFLIGIAKQESDWGKRVPVLDGQNCYNYWGYRGIRKRMGTGGHTCFDSPQDAVDTVAKRIEFLVSNE
ncbi:MAG TPA: hypothetical protein DIT25_01540, partial [Candidatus Moranbacteria bacterium]|nr:hypothetical protein [Candidatus Moranbacteria bacterium]